jgi:hypothetical protein
MKVDWRNVSHLVAAAVGVIVPGVQVAENLAWQLPGLKGAQKQDAVAELVKQAVLAVNSTGSHAVVNSAAADAATRAVIDAVVNLHKVVAIEAAAATT